MIRKLMLVALFVAPFANSAQVSTNQKAESGLADARIIAARKAASNVTAEQCLADLSSWDARDNADEKAHVEYLFYWYQKLSTEELARLSSESSACTAKLRRARRVSDSAEMITWARIFDSELLTRAEAILVEHHLMHEYLLKNSFPL